MNKQDAASSRVSFDLPPEVSGVVRLTVFDYTAKPPRPLAERLVYRRPQQRLRVAIDTERSEFSPGEEVAMSLRVTDELGRPQSAALGLSVVDDALLNLADDKSPALPTYFYLASEIESPEDLEDANFYLLEERTDDKSPAKALDLLLGTQGWRRFVQWEETLGGLESEQATDAPDDEAATDEEAADVVAADKSKIEAIERLVAMEGAGAYPTLYDNLNDIQPKFESDVAQRFSERQGRIAAAGYVSFLGGAAILVVVLMLAILQLAKDLRFWLAVSGVAAACLILGGVWMSTEINDQGKTVVTGFAGFDATQVVARNDSEDASAAVDPTEEALDLAEPADAPDEAEADPFGADAEPDAAPGEFGDDDDAEVPPAELPVAEIAADLAPEPAAAPPVLLPPGEPGFDAPVADAEFAGAEEERMRFRPLGPLADDLMALDAGWLYRDGRFARNGEADEKYNNADGESIWFDGTVHDVARMRTLLKRAMDAGDEKATMTIARAYEKLLSQYQLPVRQYAHQHTAGEPGVRTDFTETLLWQPLLITDDSGRADVRFDLSDSVTTFIVKADAHGARRIGTGGAEIYSRIPFSLEPKLPLEVNAGDRIDVPLAINNDTQSAMPVVVDFAHLGELLKVHGETKRKLNLTAGQRQREYFALDVVGQTGAAELKFQGTAGHLVDGITKRLTVVPPGFPVSESRSGRIDGETVVLIELPEDWVEGSLQVTLSAFPSTLADLQKGMEGMLRDPNGCFEQTSSSNYPNVLALAYMEEHNVADPNFTRRAKDLLDRGYDKLISFECEEGPSDKKAFEWFGGWPAHEALTAYGILEFQDMSAVHDVDPALIERATKWLLDRRDGNGGFQRNPRALDSFGGAPQEITNAYIVWALTETGDEALMKEITQGTGARHRPCG